MKMMINMRRRIKMKIVVKMGRRIMKEIKSLHNIIYFKSL